MSHLTASAKRTGVWGSASNSLQQLGIQSKPHRRDSHVRFSALLGRTVLSDEDQVSWHPIHIGCVLVTIEAKAGLLLEEDLEVICYDQDHQEHNM